MATIVLPYRGRAAAARELAHQISKAGPIFGTIDKAAKAARSGRISGSRAGRPGRISGARAYAVLAAVGEHAGVSNREVSELIGVADQGQISRLMMRLADQGLVENTGGEAQGQAKAWRLTPEGEEILHAGRPRDVRASGSKCKVKRPTSGPTAIPRARRGKSILPRGSSANPIDFRLTARTHMVLTAVDQLGVGGRGPSNREVADAAGVSDEGQISKLLARLEGLGLLENTGGQTLGHPNAWSLTLRGEDILRVGSEGGTGIDLARAAL